MNKRAISYKLLVIAFCLLLIPTVYAKVSKISRQKRKPTISSSSSRTVEIEDEEKLDIATITSQVLNLNPNLPIAEIDKNLVENAKGVAILLPQTHRYPGSETADSKNDKAVKVQGELYAIVKDLAALGISFVMAEGDLEGPVPNNVIQSIENKIELKNKFKGQKKILADNLPRTADKEKVDIFLTQIDKVISYLDRDIALSGAPYKLKAEGYGISLSGAEKLETRNKSTEIVRNYYYLTDRLSQISSRNTIGYNKPLTQTSNLSALLQSFTNKPQTLESHFGYFESLSGNENFKGGLIELKKTYSEFSALNKRSDAGNSSAPKRSDNPYISINDPAKIQKLISETVEGITDTVLNERNTDAAELFSESVSSLKLPIGIIQFGAEHKEGLIKELNDRGISVITIMAKGLGKSS